MGIERQIYAPSAAQLNATYALLASKGQPNGYAGLDGSGLVPVAQLPTSTAPTVRQTAGPPTVLSTDIVGDYALDESAGILYGPLTGTPSTSSPWINGSTSNAAVNPFTPHIARLPGLALANNQFASGVGGTTVNTVGTSRHVYIAGSACSGIRLVFTNWSTNTSQVDTPTSGTLTFQAAVEDAAGTIYQVLFNGRTLATLDAGGTILSDLINIELAAAAVFASRTYLASGTAVATRSTTGTAGSGGFVTTTNLTAPGSAAVTPSFGFSYGPAAVLSYSATGSGIALLVQGTSIEIGTGDGSLGPSGQFCSDSRWYSGGGYIMQAMAGVGGVISVGHGGDLAQDYVANAGHFLRQYYAGCANNALIGYGVNDLSAGRTPAQLQADLLTIAKLNIRYGIKRNFLITVLPNSSSTDGWATVGNQTTASWNGNRVTHNNWVRGGCPIDPTTLAPVATGTSGALLAGQAGHPIYGYFETADTVESARDSGKWAAAARTVANAALTSGASTLTSASAAFVNSLIPTGDLARTVAIAGAGTAGAYLVAQISSFNSSTSVGLTGNGVTTVSGAAMAIGVKTIDGTHPSSDAHLLMKAAVLVAPMVTG